MKQRYFNYKDYLEKRGQKGRNVRGVHKSYVFEEKASFRCLDHILATDEYTQSSGKKIIHLADHEGDIYELLQRVHDRDISYLIRSKSDRCTRQASKTDSLTLSKELDKFQDLGSIQLKIKNNSGRMTGHKMSVKACKVFLYLPQRNVRGENVLKKLATYVLEVRSQSDPKFFWRLLTSIPREGDLEKCLHIVEIYKQRWQIEYFHRVLKSGFPVEKSRLNLGRKQENYARLLSILAWRVMWMY